MDELHKKLANASLRAKDTSSRTSKTHSLLSRRLNNEKTIKTTPLLSTNLKHHRQNPEKATPTTQNSPPPSTTISDLVHINQQKFAFATLCTELNHLAQNFKKSGNLASIAEINIITALSSCSTLLLSPHPTISLTLSQAQQIAIELASLRNKLSNSINPETILLLKKGLLLSGKELKYSSLEWFLTWPFHKLSDELSDEELGVRVVNMLENREYGLELAYQGDEEVKEKMIEYCFGGYIASGEVECCDGFRGLSKEGFLDVFWGMFEETRKELGGICGCGECGRMLEGERK